ncbi:ShlB/FhaC/HecB family hemolysin secretion/activation protein [Caballeronia sp. SL2Y3]|uniref:ShlB/FhaC/HecB family hemolysin secretion/activation protein n=1 Tax=Caballeronia sp. SL2Y3 TaxID=2878151 RepID=UPI001FD2DD71|nr:ShlB/FhaC/HecB family hemolysin secretion/activation protein [Caballeronia sp. SL2Y3]
MNNGIYKLVFSRVRHMMVAVADFATGQGAQGGSATQRGSVASSLSIGSSLPMRAVAFAAMLLLGTAMSVSQAQIVAAPGSAAQVIQTQNGLQQVNIAKPSAAGVSLNNYSQFDIPSKGAILNNSPTLVQTQQAGYINGNPNLSSGQSAGIIVNQVLSNSPSQLNGYLEVAGQRAEVVVANPNGLVVNGGGFINTSRAILTTGTPNFGANGSLAGFNVTGGNITVQGAGLNATNVDQVDLLSRAIQVNAAIYANNVNVVAGSNQVDHSTLAATPIAGNGPAPSVAIDVSALGGMYANRIYLVSNEYGVGVSNKGVLAAQAGDLTLQSNGQLVLAGTTNASGSINASAAQGIQNSGTTYAQQNVVASTAGTLTNSGVVAALNNTTINAGSVASTGTLGAGVNSNGAVGNTNTYYQQIAGVNQTFVSSGNAQTAGFKFARVLHRGQNDVFGGYAQLSKRFGASFIDDTEIVLQHRNNTFFETGLTDRHYFGGAQFDGSLAYRQGINEFGATGDPSQPADANIAPTPATKPSGPTYLFHMAMIDANLSVPFAIASQPLRYVTTFHGQYTNDTLFYIDDLTIGSRYTVRGFDGEQMLAGEKGFYWRNELQAPIGKTGQTLYAGIDYGHVFGPNTAFLAGTQLVGAVIGIRGGVPSKYAGFSYDLFAGTPLYKPATLDTSRVTLGSQMTAQF